MLRRTACIIIALTLAGPAAAANCSVAPFSTVPGADTSTRMVVHSGLPCVISMTVRGGGMQMAIGQRPVNGTASTPGSTSFAYVSRPGFVGNDRFVAEFTGELMSSQGNRIMRGTSHIDVAVAVVR